VGITWSFLVGGYLSLFAAAYFDIIRGPLLPSIAADLGLAFSASGAFLTIGQAVGLVLTFLMIGALNRWSERTIMAGTCVIGIGACLVAPQVHSFGALLGLGSLIGIVIAVLDAMANILVVEAVPVHLQGRFLSGLHSIYGLASLASASVVGVALMHGMRWSSLYAAALPAYVALLIFAWRTLGNVRAKAERTVQSARLSRLQMLVVLVFAVYVAGEVATSMWLVSYLVQKRGLTASGATTYLMLYFLVYTLVRLACAFFIQPRHEKTVLHLALIASVAAFVLADLGPTWAFAFVGLFGPFFPVFLARVSRSFPLSWRSLTIWIMAAMNVTIGLANLTIGRLADTWGMPIAFLLPPALLASALLLLLLYFRLEPPAAGGGL